MVSPRLESIVGVVPRGFLMNDADGNRYMAVHGFDSGHIVLVTVAKLVNPGETNHQAIPQEFKLHVRNLYQSMGIKAPIVFNNELSYFQTDEFVGMTL